MRSKPRGLSASLVVLTLAVLSATACGEGTPTGSTRIMASAFVGAWDLYEVFGEPLLHPFEETRWGCDIGGVNHPGTSHERVRSGALSLEADGTMALSLVVERRCVTDGGSDSGWIVQMLTSQGRYTVDGDRAWLADSEEARLVGGQLHFMVSGHALMRWKKRQG